MRNWVVMRIYASAHPPHTPTKMKVLLVDDDERIRRLLRSIVSDMGSEIIECGDGDEAVCLYTEHQPDWVLMDVGLGATCGISATRRICDGYPNARVVMVTSFDDDDTRAEAREAGACGYVVKENLLDVRGILAAAV